MANGEFRVKVGEKITYTKRVSDEDIHDFARITGDVQRIHLDEPYAGRTRFKRRAAHGVLTLGLVSAALGTRLPNAEETAIYVSQNLRFTRPVFIGDTVTVNLEVVGVNPDRRLVTLSTNCVNQTNDPVMTGEAVVLLDPYPFPES